jgi:Sensors of blue-light using FAD
MLRSTMYLSHSRLSLPDDTAQLAAIHHLSVARNRDLDLTGLLIVAPDHFGQYLEGEGDAVDAVMASICRDQRHDRVVVLPTPQLGYRRFPNWRMAWFGPDAETTKAIQPILDTIDATSADERAAELLRIMEDLSPASRD